MEPVSVVTGRACPIDANDVDTDQIIPKQYLKRVERTGFGPFAFAEWRYLDDGSPNPAFQMNMPEHAGAPIMVAGRNFGCGSSREHAPWALEDAGFKAIIAPSFADIFRNNCGKIGVVAVQLDEQVVQQLFDLIAADPSVQVTVDLEAQRVTAEAVGELAGVDVPFDIHPHTRYCLLNGLDDIGMTLQHADAIAEYEAGREAWRPKVPAR
ncbi:3-isopropylmalate dehydratase small subunit [Nitriliruptor alkaliphilus]|uniref:3-isopropylmalate dehydratase small subunit n=1 Tax=Nitriliruptor alkaliphilus TaxID=427918 RepID=UPI0006984264|nr:3-isopropylmalate dehydratase small subunit [Nitriliruptor alkaliphilus]